MKPISVIEELSIYSQYVRAGYTGNSFRKQRRTHMKLRTPIKAIRAKCIDCSGDELTEVRDCRHDDCPLHLMRMGSGSRSNMDRIRSYCLLCCNGQRTEVRLCPTNKCSLWAYRFGMRPKVGSFLAEIGATQVVLETNAANEEIVRGGCHNQKKRALSLMKAINAKKTLGAEGKALWISGLYKRFEIFSSLAKIGSTEGVFEPNEEKQGGWSR